LEKGFAEFELWRDEQLALEELERHKLDRNIAMEEDWVRYGVTARRKRNVGRMARLMELRRERREQLKSPGQVKFTVTDAAHSGTRAIEAIKIGKAYGDLVVVKDFSIRILKGDRVGIVGPNGAGKTTLLELLTGRLAPDSGAIKLGANLALAVLDQKRTVLDPEARVADVLTGGGDIVEVGGQKRHVVSYMKDFLFLPEQARSPVRVLSGGERARLLIAKALAAPSNLLVLDEPTNDLDLETLDLLEETIADYPGTVLVVSHDRDFLDRIATAVLMAEGNGVFLEYAGGYSDMLAQRGEGVGVKAREPQKAKERAAAHVRAPSARKLSFNEKHALETLPKRIAELETLLGKTQKELNDATLYARDPKKFASLSETLTKAQAELAAAEERWLELEILREEIAKPSS
jgi:ATP-binding cassette subfamily F protein uup